MKKITKEAAVEKHGLSPRRRCFANHTGLQTQKNTKSFSVKFNETIEPIFKEMTGYNLFHSEDYDNYYRLINNEEELEKIKNWESQQGVRVFLRDCLDLSIALSTNLYDNQSGTLTPIGLLEKKAKNFQDRNSIEKLSELSISTINSLPYYNNADFICAVPSSPEKNFDLPSNLASLISKQTKKPNVTSGFTFNAEKFSAKVIPFDQRWDMWDNTGLNYFPNRSLDIKGKNIILIDDKYQSGTTIQFVAMKLQQAGAGNIYGLNIVKTLRDTDNQ